MIKPILRQLMREKLAALPSGDFQRRGAAAATRLMATPEYQQARSIFVFLAMSREIDTDALISAALAEGRVVSAPRVDWALRCLYPVRLNGLGKQDVRVGERGIREPRGDVVIPVAEIDLAVLPGLAFDATGMRLGRSGGFFDRFLADPQCRAVRCGFALDEQIAAYVPMEPHDQRVDLIVTDTRVMRGLRAGPSSTQK